MPDDTPISDAQRMAEALATVLELIGKADAQARASFERDNAGVHPDCYPYRMTPIAAHLRRAADAARGLASMPWPALLK